MKKSVLFSCFIFGHSFLYAQNSLDTVSGEIVNYLPVIRGLAYVLAAIIAIAGSLVIYIQSSDNNASCKKKIMMLIGACIFLIAASSALPMFFGLDETNMSYTGIEVAEDNSYDFGDEIEEIESSLDEVEEYEEYEGDYIKTEIPELESDEWIKFPEGTSTKAIETAINLWQKYWKPNISNSQLRTAMMGELDKMWALGEISTAENMEIAKCLDYILTH